MVLSWIQHFFLILIAGIAFDVLDRKQFMLLTIIAIELDQALSYSGVRWFGKLDTWGDILFGLAGLIMSFILYKEQKL